MSISTGIESNTDSVDVPRRVSSSFSFALGSPSDSTLPQSTTYTLCDTNRQTVLIDSDTGDSAIHTSGGHREVATSMTINYENNCDPFDLTLVGNNVQTVASRDRAPTAFKRPSPLEYENERPNLQTNTPYEPPAFPDISTGSPGWPTDDNREDDTQYTAQKRVHFASDNTFSDDMHAPRYVGAARCAGMHGMRARDIMDQPSFLEGTLGLQDSNELDLSLREPSKPTHRKANVGVLSLMHTRLKLDMRKIMSRCRRWDTYFRNKIAAHKFEGRADRQVTPNVRRSQRNRVTCRLAAHERLIYRRDSYGFPVLAGVEARPDPPSPTPRGIWRQMEYECDKEMIEEEQAAARKRRAALQRHRFAQLTPANESNSPLGDNASSSHVTNEDSFFNIDASAQLHHEVQPAAAAPRGNAKKASSGSKSKKNNPTSSRSPDVASRSSRRPKRVVLSVDDSDAMNL